MEKPKLEGSKKGRERKKWKEDVKQGLERRRCNKRRETDGVLKGTAEKKENQQKAVWKNSRKER